MCVPGGGNVVWFCVGGSVVLCCWCGSGVVGVKMKFFCLKIFPIIIDSQNSNHRNNTTLYRL